MKDIHYKMLFACTELIMKVLKTEETTTFKHPIGNNLYVNISVEKQDTHYVYYIAFEYKSVRHIIMSISMDSLPAWKLPVDQNATLGESLVLCDKNLDFDTQSQLHIGQYLQDVQTFIPVQEDIFEEWGFQQSLVYDYVPSKENYYAVKDLMKSLTAFGITFFCITYDQDAPDDFFTAVHNCTQLYQREVLDDKNI